MNAPEDRLQALLERMDAGETVDEVRRSVDDPALRADFEAAVFAAAILPVRAPAAMRARQQAYLQSLMGEGDAAEDRAVAIGASGWRGPWRRWATRVVAITVAVALLLGSTVAVSATTLPGESLYGVKLATERARVALTRDPLARSELRLSLVDRRVEEIRALVDRGVMPGPDVIERMLGQRDRLFDERLADPAFQRRAEARLRDTGRTLVSLAAGVREESPETAQRLAAAAARIVPEEGSGGSEDGGPSGADENADVGGARSIEPEPSASVTSGRANAPAVEERATVAPATQTERVRPTVTPTSRPSATPVAATFTPAPTASSASGGGGGITEEPTAVPSDPPTAAPSAEPDPTQAPGDPTAVPEATDTQGVPMPRATIRAQTATAEAP